VQTYPFFGAPSVSRRWFPSALAMLLAVFAATVGESLLALPADASPALLQHANKDAGTTLSSSLVFPLNNSAGNWIGVVIRAGHAGQVLTVSDTRGNTYQQALQFNQTLDTPNGETVAIYYAENIASGANAVTVSESISNNTLRFAILEYSGLAASNSLDATIATLGSGAALNSGNVSTTSGGDLVLGVLVTANGATFTGGSGLTIEERVPAAPNTKLMVEDGIQTLAGSVAANAMLTASDNWGAGVATFKAAGGVLPPSISNLIPVSGPVGTSVTITGTNFGATQGNSTVTFNGTAATPTSWSATSIAVPVPAGATTGNVAVTVGGLASSGVAFNVLATPVITGLSPASGSPSTIVTISGTKFGLSQGGSTVTFNGTIASPTSWNASTIVVPVPVGANSGSVIVTVNGVASSGSPFNLTPISVSVSPATATISAGGGTSFTATVMNEVSNNLPKTGVTWTLSGTGCSGSACGTFFAAAGPYFASYAAPSTLPSPPTVSFMASSNADPTKSATATINLVQTPAPVISSLSPSSGISGTSVNITGTNFGAGQGANTVWFNGTVAAVTSWANSSILATVPSFAPGFQNAIVTVVVNGLTSNGVNFSLVPPPNISSLSSVVGPVGSSVTITGTNFGTTQGTSSVNFNGTPAAPASAWSTTSITVLVPANATTGSVVVTVNNVASNGVNFIVTPPPPSIASINPLSGPVGSLVILSGANFGATQGTSTVTFNGVPAGPALSWNPTSAGVAVPSAATTGNVVVTVGGSPSNGLTFTIGPDITPPTAPPNLISTAISPAGASLAWNASTDNVGITSYLVERCQGAGCTTFAQIVAVQAPNTSVADTSLVAATSYSYRVRATDPAGNLSAYSNVLSITTTSGPVIQSCNPIFGPTGTPVTIGGTGFGATQGSSTVTFNGVTANPTGWSDTSVNVPVPAGAATGSLVVTVAGVSSSVTFVVTPTITMLNPISGPRGTSVTITGTNFGASVGASTVTFNGVPGTSTSWSDTSIVVPVPFGATSGNVLVTVGGGVNGHASNGVFFTVTTALVQHASKDAGTTSSSSLVFPVSNTFGNWIGVVIRAGHSGQVFTVNDTRGNTYRQAVLFNQTLDTPNGDTFAIFYAENIAGGANTVTVSDAISNNTLRFALLEYSGLAASNSLDVTAAAQGTGASVSSGSVTTTAAGDLILGALMTGSGVTYTPGGGFAIEERVPAAPNTKLAVEDQIQGTAGVVTANATLSSSATWGSAAAAFKSASGATGTPPNITSLNPASGPVGTPVTITGTNFGAPQGNSTVTFNGIVVTPGSWSTTGISVLVPTVLATGNATIIVTVNNAASNGATFTVTAPPSISVGVTPVRGGVTITQPLALAASVQNDSSNAGVSWTVSGGSLSGQTIFAATFTATAAGTYTITATSKADVTKSASAVIGVTDLAGVNTWRNDSSRSGVNSQEYALTTQNVTTNTFGKLFSCAVDGWVFAQPLWLPNVTIGSAKHNLVLVATENDSLYAFDADGPGCKPVWSTANVKLIPNGEVVAPFADLENDNALGPVVGITGTPVIDPSSQTIYLVAMTEVSGTTNIVQRLHAIDVTTGQERPGSPQIISASMTGTTGYDNSNGTITFAPKFQKQRPALLLLNGVIYISWAGFLDTDFYHGWLIGYDAATLNPVTIFNDTPDGGRGGIWMSGGGPAADAQGNIYLLTGNGDFNATTGGRNYGDTFLKLGTSSGLSVTDWFTPHDQSNMANNDLDLGGGGAVILLDQPAGPLPHLVLGGSKGGMLYVVNRDGLGHFNSANDSQIVQSFTVGSNGIYSAPLFWQNTLYAAASGSPLSAYPFSPTNDQFQTAPSIVSSQVFGHPGTTPSLSAAGTSNAILWAIRRSSATAPAVLHAFDATNIHAALWDSSQATGSRDLAGVAVKFTVPTVANGKVYVGTQTELDVYGLLPN